MSNNVENKRRVNRQFLLLSRPIGDIKESNFEYKEVPIPTLNEGEVLIRNLYLSLDPTNRIWMSDMVQYMPPVELGEVMRGVAMGVVEESKNSNLRSGDIVTGLLGWQDYAVLKEEPVNFITKIHPPLPNPLFTAVGLLGATGVTAYFGLLDIGQPKPGETVVVSAATGAVGSVVGQIAAIKGCRVVGITSSDEKCQWLTSSLGFDAAINYKNTDLNSALAIACPKGVDIYFDNVGGSILDTVMSHLNLFARIPLCGLISTYNSTEPVPGPYNFGLILMKRVRIQGFIISDYRNRWHEAIKDLGQWMESGKIKQEYEIVEGLENAPKAIHKLFNANKIGKLIVKISSLN
ncbi:NADP-dependent oxidoreductase [Plectonema cf. radiosum LEGE 06105]|uniref:NADP-dependent oxidoreductase n=1 Tax=Plectonema cf. radiosum LEGE 06105 TaxID=945769 RepID=A0A8J7F0L3_9CYAN|nr:NADP-dependent oxidoreductase [Plectonema radiosum]MBE9212310.1 NADP-dependent oxidoreductase [Plectonema cf. radiosum LEGE 06105]